jgi:hypothetical protein
VYLPLQGGGAVSVRGRRTSKARALRGDVEMLETIIIRNGIHACTDRHSCLSFPHKAFWAAQWSQDTSSFLSPVVGHELLRVFYSAGILVFSFSSHI